MDAICEPSRRWVSRLSGRSGHTPPAATPVASPTCSARASPPPAASPPPSTTPRLTNLDIGW